MASLRRQLALFVVGLLIGLGFMVLLTPPSSIETGPYTITTAGSSTVFSLSQIWAVQFQNEYPAFIVNPGTGGSGLGQSQISQKLIDIGASSSYPNQDYIDSNPGVRILPVSADALGIVVNPSVNGSTFKMDCDMAVAIFERNVTTWDEFSTVFGVSLQQTGEIDVYVRSDASGTTATFTKWLETAEDNPNLQANYTWDLGHSETVSWAPGINSVDGNPGVATGVLGNDHGIGYVGLAFMEGLTPVDLYNPTTKEYVAPSLQNALRALPEDLTDPGANLMNSAIPGSYPIARLLYYLVHEENVAWHVLVFLTWVLVRGQTFIPDVGYVPINGTSAAEYSVDVIASLSPT